MIDLLTALYRLKDEERAGWRLRGVFGAESVADHSWATALLCLLMAPSAGLDVARAVSIALVHDIAEAVTGDRPARITDDGRPADEEAKRMEEEQAMERLFPMGSDVSARIHALWQDYERKESLEALFARDMNLIDMCLQALIYESERRFGPADGDGEVTPERRLSEFLSSSEARLSTSFGRELFLEIAERYRTL